MKDSGIPWIGEIPADWSIVKIKAGVHKVGSGKTPSGGATSYADEGVLFLRSQNVYDTGLELSNPTYITPEVDEEMKGTRVFPNDVLLNITGGSIGRCCIFPETLETANVNQHVSIIRVNKNVFLPEFMHYYWISPLGSMAISLYQTGGNREGMSAEAIKNTPIILMPLVEQKLICKVLDAKCAEIDAVLDKTRTSIEEYKKLKQAIITQAVTKGTQGDRAMKESGIEWIRSIPVEWEVVPAKRLFRNSDERKHPDDEQLTASQKYGVISQQQYMEKEDTRIVLASQGIENWKHVEPYDFIISLRSFQGGLEMSEVSGCITWHYIVLKPLRPIHSFYFKWLFKSELYIKALQRTCNFIRDGQDIRYSNFVQVPLFIPPLEEQKEIADFLNIQCAEIDAPIKKKVQFLAELEAYKKSLIYEYVTGKKEMPLAQIQSCISFIDARVLLMCRIIELLKPKGRIHLMKALYTVDCMLNLNSTTQYQRQKHGPYDARIEEYEKVLMKNGWVDIKAGSPVKYTQTETFEAYREKYQSYYGHIDDDIQRLCSFLQPMKTSKAERVATLLAAWNDFILQGIKPTDSQLVQEVRSNWTPNKAHSSKSTWLGTLVEMKAYKIIPSGYGKCTVHMK